MRRVMTMDWRYDQEKKEVVYTDVAEGWFHRWGDEYEEYTEGPIGQSTVAIVEIDGGHVKTVPPHTIRFLDEPDDLDKALRP